MRVCVFVSTRACACTPARVCTRADDARTHARRLADGPPRPSAEADGVEATFDVIYLTGWAPSDSQRKPSARGSATVSLHDLQELSEREAAGEAAPERSGGGSSRGGGDSA